MKPGGTLLDPPTTPSRDAAVLWARGFRPFFLLAAGYGCLAPLAWIGVLHWVATPSAFAAPVAWHAHEMLFGVIAAAIAGFLLTSVPVWTGTRPVQGGGLAILVALWLVGRGAVLAAPWLPPGWVAAADLSFLPALAFAIGRPLAKPGQRRNQGFPLVLLGLAACNAAAHAGALGGAFGAPPGTTPAGLRLAVLLVIVLIVVIGGRITPAFTRNALARAGTPREVRSHPWVERLAIAAALAVPIGELAAPRTRWSGLVAGAAAIAIAVRMAGWQTLSTRRDPLLWSLHLGYAWIPVGLGLLALADLGGPIAWTVGLHALTAGAMGSMLLAVMSRVALGHTGRPLVAPPGAVAAYLLVALGTLVRIAGPTLLPAHGLPLTTLGGLLWSAAFGVFALVAAPILLRPRVDGQPG